MYAPLAHFIPTHTQNGQHRGRRRQQWGEEGAGAGGKEQAWWGAQGLWMLGGGLTLMGTLLLGNANGNSTGMEEADEQEVGD